MSTLIVLPTVTGREEALAKAIASFNEAAGDAQVSVQVIKDRGSCGEAWLEGAEGKEFDYVLFGADDQVALEGYLPPLIEAADKGDLACCVVLNPDGSIQSAGGDLGAAGHVRTWEQPDWTEVGFAPIPFLNREQYERIGVLPIHYYSDVWFSLRGRQLGYSVVLRTESRIVHDYHTVGRTMDKLDEHRKVCFDALMEHDQNDYVALD